MGDCRHSIGEAARQVRVFTPVASLRAGYEQCWADIESLITQPVSRCPPLRQVLVEVECSFAH